LTFFFFSISTNSLSLPLLSLLKRTNYCPTFLWCARIFFGQLLCCTVSIQIFTSNHFDFERLNLGQHLTELTFWPTGMSTKQAILTNTNPEWNYDIPSITNPPVPSTKSLSIVKL
jgi:hypothetical protein